MPEIFKSFRLFLSIWFKELKHDSAKLLHSKIKFFLSIGFATFFMMLLFWGFFRVLDYVKSTPIVGMALAGRLVGTVFFALFIMLIYSSIITAFSTLYFSDDNNFLVASPFNWGGILMGKLVQTTYHSSWMSVIVLFPLFLSLGIVFDISLTGYLIMVPGTLLYFLAASAFGAILVIFVVRIFPARKVRDLLILGLVILGTSFYILFRTLNLEQVLRPGQESLAANYLKVFELPRAPYLPSYWISKLAIEFMNKRAGWLFPSAIILFQNSFFIQAGKKSRVKKKRDLYLENFQKIP
ncbi:hypothetical protein ACFLUV_07210 [Elusimicrobiota bacterium]